MGSDLKVERLALRLLCTGTLQDNARSAMISLLRDHLWQSTLHQAIFDAIRTAPSSDPQVLRQLLPAILTRMGFPDVEWEEIFSPPSLSKDEAIAMVRQMLAGS